MFVASEPRKLSNHELALLVKKHMRDSARSAQTVKSVKRLRSQRKTMESREGNLSHVHSIIESIASSSTILDQLIDPAPLMYPRAGMTDVWRRVGAYLSEAMQEANKKLASGE